MNLDNISRVNMGYQEYLRQLQTLFISQSSIINITQLLQVNMRNNLWSTQAKILHKLIKGLQILHQMWFKIMWFNNKVDFDTQSQQLIMFLIKSVNNYNQINRLISETLYLQILFPFKIFLNHLHLNKYRNLPHKIYWFNNKDLYLLINDHIPHK